MSIASEITRLQTAKADLKTSIESKGVSVSASATLDDYADYVDSISTGGSATEDLLWTNPDPTVSFDPQTVTLSGNLSNYTYVKVGFCMSVNYTDTEIFDITYCNQLPTQITNSNTVTGSIAYRASSYYYVRAYGAPSNTSIVFSDAIRQTTKLNTSLIPLHIYGVNT